MDTVPAIFVVASAALWVVVLIAALYFVFKYRDLIYDIFVFSVLVISAIFFRVPIIGYPFAYSLVWASRRL
jgi:hypothetical protein